MRKLATLTGILLSSSLVTTEVLAHGSVSHPISRQYQCYKQGGFWGSLESIPNAGCRESVRISEQYPLVQWNEGAANPSPRHDQKAIEKAVPNGKLCAAGDPKKKGLDAPQSAGWLLTPIKPGKMDMTWAATAPHNPAKLTVYITKNNSDYYNRELRWSDLDLANPLFKGDMPMPDRSRTPAEYRIPLTIPNRSGKAIIYSIWQREDTGNEGFFNCSDVLIQGSGEPSDPTDAWLSEKPFLSPADKPVAGDTARFRLLGGNLARGTEVVDVRVPISAQNLHNHRWAEELADKVNKEFSRVVQIGVKHNGHIQYEPSSDQLYQNMVWVKNAMYTSSLSIISGEIKPPPGNDDDNGNGGDNNNPGDGNGGDNNNPGDGNDNSTGYQYKWPDKIAHYAAGTVVLGVDGKLWKCRPFPQSGWCKINHPAYTPGGRDVPKDAGSQAWEPVK